MASQYAAQLMRFGQSLLSGSARLARFLRHRLLTQKRAMLVVGSEDSPIFSRLHKQFVPSWDFVLISEKTENNAAQLEKGLEGQQESVDTKEVQPAKESDKAKQSFARISLNGRTFSQVESQLQGKQFDSIVILPQRHVQSTPQLTDDSFPQHFHLVHEQLFSRNILAYRLASKHLAASGVLIFSASQKDFTKERQVQQEKEDILSGLADAQTCYLGVVVGDRDHTDLNSWSVVALTQELSETESELVANYYRLWSEGQQLPMPGSFALFKKNEKGKSNHFVQYL